MPTPSQAPIISSLDTALGTWYLHEAYAVDESDNRLHDLYGARPDGVIHYLPEGRMSVLITHDGRKPIDGDRQAAPADQRAEAYSGCIAYAGTYSLHDGWVHHEIDLSTYHNWVGTTLRRLATFDGCTLTLLTPPQMQNGRETVLKLLWRREPRAASAHG